MSQPIEAVMAGAGNRGYYAYGPYALQHPDEIRFTAVVEPHDERHRRFAEAHDIPLERQFRTWKDLYAKSQIAQTLVNCTLDRMHLDSTLPALKLGYDDCPFHAPRLYLTDYTGWPVSVISEDLSLEARRRALEAGPYGRCVYRCDNDVVDHQTVNVEFESGATGVLFMHGHSHKESRTMRYDGTRATLRGKLGYGTGSAIEIHDHVTGRVERIDFQAEPGGHGGGDAGVMAAFVKALHDPGPTLTTARESLESHLMAFAAEEARVNGGIVYMDDFHRRALRSGSETEEECSGFAW